MKNNFKKVVGIFAIGFIFRYLIDILDMISNYIGNKFSLRNNDIALTIDKDNKESQVEWTRQQAKLEEELGQEELSNPIGFTVE